MKNNFRSSNLFKTTLPFLTTMLLLPITSIGSPKESNQNTSYSENYSLTYLGKVDNSPNANRLHKINNKIIHTMPNVLPPTPFSTYLLEHTEIHKGESVLDIGTGSGIQAIFAAEKASHVQAMDIDEQAVINTKFNARRLGLSHKISARKSDLFNALNPDEKFDVIISSIPYAWDVNTRGNWKLQERFFRNVGKHLKSNGRIYFITGWLKNLSHTRGLIRKNNLKIIRVDMHFEEERNLEPIVYVIKHKPPGKITKK